MKPDTLIRTFLCAAVVCAACATGGAGAAEGEGVRALRAEMAELRAELARLQKRVSEQDEILRALREGERDDAAGRQTGGEDPAAEEDPLAGELAAELGGPAAPEAERPGGQTTLQPLSLARGRNYLNLSLSALAAGGTSSARDVTEINRGGHDPVQRGFTVQNIEATLDGAVDPYFRGQANVIFLIDDEGETVVELEEAFLTTTSLPANLQAKAGTYFTEFGRHNPQHPHFWDFVDQPLANNRFLGPDGLRGPGARLSWLVPTPFYAEAFLSVQNGRGETAVSFRGEEDEELFGRVLTDRPVSSGGDLLYAPRLAVSFDLSDTTTILAGLSGAFGPNSSGPDTRTGIYGADLFWKWRPVNAQAGFPFLKWQTEAMLRRYEAGAFAADTDDDGIDDFFLPEETLEDWGAYSQILWGFRRGWVAGLRGEVVDGEEAAFTGDPDRMRRWRVSPNLTWFPTEYSKLRLQYNRDEIEGAGSEDSLWLQVEFILGAHAAHKF